MDAESLFRRRLQTLIDEKYGSLDRFYLERQISKGHISNILRGKRNPSIATVARLARLLGVEVSDFFVRDERRSRGPSERGPTTPIVSESAAHASPSYGGAKTRSARARSAGENKRARPDLGRRVLELIREKFGSPERFHLKTRFPKAALSRIVAASGNPSLAAFEALARLLEVEVRDLFVLPERGDRERAFDLLAKADADSVRRVLQLLSPTRI